MKGRSFKSATSKLARFSVVCYGWLKRNACVFCSNVKSEEALRPMSVFLDCTFGRLPQTSQQALSNLTGTHGLHSIQASLIMCGMISGLKHAAMCKLWPYCKPYILYFVFFMWDWNVQNMQILYDFIFVLAFGFINICFCGCYHWYYLSCLLLCSFSLFYVKVISDNLRKQYSASGIYESWQFFCR